MESSSTEKGTTEKKSFSIDRDELKWLERFAKARKMSASAVMSLAVRMLRESEQERQKRERAYRQFMRTIPPSHRATPAEQEALLKKWRRPR
jgi:hypothetical protein